MKEASDRSTARSGQLEHQHLAILQGSVEEIDILAGQALENATQVLVSAAIIYRS